MPQNSLKYEIQHVLSGKSQVGHGALIQAVASYLKASTPAGAVVEADQQYKQQETARLVEYAEQNEFWVNGISFSNFVSAGAEQRVYIKDGRSVYKLNDSIYYASWVDYLHNLLLNNFFFPDTAYQLVGFYRQENTLYAVVTQPFVRANQPTDLSLVKAFMNNNGFENTRNHDYYNPELGIILEDLHDENVLTQNGILFFIDTVFYVKPEVVWT
ncbi:MAG: hypothetical protein WBA23_25385 [Tunicatimonas sp.]|uniref:putative polyvalent protein kinase domain-containing protein n=1 Tax=Tunicatimonas sp. TaxID=1940096 RepID=UPI003C778E76